MSNSTHRRVEMPLSPPKVPPRKNHHNGDKQHATPYDQLVHRVTPMDHLHQAVCDADLLRQAQHPIPHPLRVV